MKKLMPWCVLMGLAGSPGCSGMDAETETRSSPSHWNRIVLADTTPDRAFDEAIVAVRQYFPAFDASRADMRIITPMVEYSQRGGTERIRDSAFKPNNRMRRRATLIVSPNGDGSVALCEVRVQRLDTADHRAFQQHREFNDVPNSTPIQRDAGVSGAQSETWTEMPRDSKLERDILQIIFNRVKPVKEDATTQAS
jgi:hypothetical protein